MCCGCMVYYHDELIGNVTDRGRDIYVYRDIEVEREREREREEREHIISV